MVLPANVRPTVDAGGADTVSHFASANPPSVFSEYVSIFDDATMDDATPIHRRREDVREAQHRLNMTPRDDSRLTELFAHGHLPPYMTADVVARELMCTDFIFKNTLYGEVIEDYMRAVAVSLRDTYKLSWDATWNITRFYAPIALKLMCVSSSGVRVPNAMSAPNCTN
jgi:hypothetical protein